MLAERTQIGLVAGPLLFLAVLLLPLPEGMAADGQRVAAVTVLMAVWWITEAIPIPATALLPVLLFPLLGVMDAGEVTLAYGHHLIFLFLGGFMIAVTMQRWNLHHRIALHTIRLVGITPRRIILGFMLATAFLSMWVSNTATTMMMVTIAVAVLREVEGGKVQFPAAIGFGTALMLGICYAASIGGIATLIGTPPNAIFAGVVETTLGYSIGFAEWMSFGLPLSITMLAVAWFYLVRFVYRGEGDVMPGGSDYLRRQLAAIGPASREEKAVALVFLLVASLWILRGLVDLPWLSGVKDSTIAIGGALLLFLVPVNLRERRFLLDWKTAVTIPWDIIILFGGGFALAKGFSSSGLTRWLAEQLSVLQGSDIVLIIAAVALLVVFLTEVTSNTATSSLLLPVMGALAAAIEIHPYGLMVTAVIAASFAFMLPVATPPNAIVFGSRYVTIPQMARAGIWLNLVGAGMITAFVTWVLPFVWGIAL